MSPRLQAALVLAGVFSLGAITGGAAVHFQQARRSHAKLGGQVHQGRLRSLLAALNREVDLDEAQRLKVREIVAAYEPEMKEIRRGAAPRLAALRTKIAGEIRGVLRPEQIAAFDQFLKKQEERALEDR